ncbi:50S ribosomal protein P1 [archaeon]|nr:50S ribosomal protein P1 [archaeon]
MEYIYSALLLHSAKQEINEANVGKVLQAAGVSSDSAKVKALVASLKDVNIDEAISKAAMPVAVAAAPAAGATAGQAEGKKAEKEEKGKTEEEAAEGLGALFG